jgi:hypothetical protein
MWEYLSWGVYLALLLSLFALVGVWLWWSFVQEVSCGISEFVHLVSFMPEVTITPCAGDL